MIHLNPPQDLTGLYDFRKPAAVRTEARYTAADRASLKARMRKVGLSYRKAAPQVGVCFNYLCDILNSRRPHTGHAVCSRLEDLITDTESDRQKAA